MDFSLRSVPLPSKELTFSGRFDEMKKHFDFLIKETKIVYAVVNKEIFCFIAFGSNFSNLNIPNSIQHVNDILKSREFTFGASRANQIFLAKNAAHDIFKYMKDKYNIQYIISEIVREKKRNKFMSVAKRVFKFNIINEFAYYEIP